MERLAGTHPPSRCLAFLPFSSFSLSLSLSPFALLLQAVPPTPYQFRIGGTMLTDGLCPTQPSRIQLLVSTSRSFHELLSWICTFYVFGVQGADEVGVRWHDDAARWRRVARAGKVAVACGEETGGVVEQGRLGRKAGFFLPCRMLATGMQDYGIQHHVMHPC